MRYATSMERFLLGVSGMIYFDHAATTYVKQEVLDEMTPVFAGQFGNPSGVYGPARDARHLLAQARGRVAAALGAKPAEVYFTSGGTEADNWALKGIAQQHPGRHIITSSIEHSAVHSTCEYLEQNGWQVDYLPVDTDGLVDPDAVRRAIRPDTVLASIMFANNEIGTIQPVAQIGAVCRKKGVLFHTDAVQAFGSLPIDVDAMNIDLLSLSAHKLYGPKGVGALYVCKGTKLQPLIHGGGQERGRRSGTENVPGIVGLGKAAEVAVRDMQANTRHALALRDRLQQGLLAIPDTRLNGHPSKRLPNNLSVSFAGVEGEALVMKLDMEGIAVSAGSACSAGALERSHVLRAIDQPSEMKLATLRFSIGSRNTQQEVDIVLQKVPGIVERLRSMAKPDRTK